MGNVADILRFKGHQVYATSPTTTVLEAAQRMNEHRVGALVVLADNQLVGLFSERDVLQRVVAQSRDPETTLVEEVMTTEVICGTPHTTLEEARSAMKNRRIRHLPILEEGRLLGMVSIGDLNAHHADSQERTIHLMEAYIYGQT